MICRRIKKANITNVDVVTEPANEPSTFVMAKSKQEPAKGLISKAIDLLSGLVKGRQEVEYETVDAEAGIYDLTYGLVDTVGSIMSQEIADKEKQTEVAKAVNEYQAVITKYLFDGDAAGDVNAQEERAGRLALLRDRISQLLPDNRRSELEQEVVKGTGGETVANINIPDGGTVAGAAADSVEVNPAAEAGVQLSATVTEGGSGTVPSEVREPEEQPNVSNSGSVELGRTAVGSGSELAGTGVVGDEGASNGSAALGQASVTTDKPIAASSEGVGGQCGEVVAVALSADENILIALQKRIGEAEVMLAKANIKSEISKYADLGIPVGEMVEVFYTLSKANPAQYETLKTRMDAIAQAGEIAKGLLGEIGRNKDGIGNSDASPVDKIEAIAKGIAEKERISMTNAKAKAWTEHPEIYREYLNTLPKNRR